MYTIDVDDRCEKKFSKLNPFQMQIVRNKIAQILENPFHYKPLRGDMKGLRRVHIDKSFVLTYEVVGDTVRILDYDHHDRVYEP